MSLITHIKRRAATGLLLLVALGQFAAAAHALDHGIAEQLERCATCVHLDQGSQVPASSQSVGFLFPRSTESIAVCAASAPQSAISLFDARAPPL